MNQIFTNNIYAFKVRYGQHRSIKNNVQVPVRTILKKQVSHSSNGNTWIPVSRDITRKIIPYSGCCRSIGTEIQNKLNNYE